MITIINGGTQGLGEAVARRRVETGFTSGMVLSGRSVERGAALADELTAAGVDTIFVEADMAAPGAPGAVVDATVERFGRVNGVVNVAAITTRANLFTDTHEHVDHQFAVNVKAPYFLIQAAARHMVEHGERGSIVNVGSVAGHGGAPKLTAYSMSKAALSVMTSNLAYGLMRHGIRVNQVNPGWMETESEHRIQMEEDGQPENWLELAAPTRPFGRLVQPWEVANLISFCLSDESGLLTGNHIDVDQSVLGAGDGGMPQPGDTISP
jgi:NAD(P)-dependent dehydrogenase (short-subunit alcohol dehydrogenase family)